MSQHNQYLFFLMSCNKWFKITTLLNTNTRNKRDEEVQDKITLTLTSKNNNNNNNLQTSDILRCKAPREELYILLLLIRLQLYVSFGIYMSTMQTAPLRQTTKEDEAYQGEGFMLNAEYLALKRWHFLAFLVVIGIILGLLGALCVTQYRITYILTHAIKRIHGDTGHLLIDLDL